MNYNIILLFFHVTDLYFFLFTGPQEEVIIENGGDYGDGGGFGGDDFF